MAFNSQDRDAMIGKTIGACRIEAPIGGGATSYVFRAEHLALSKQVAIKILDAEMSASEEAREAFFEEARIAASIEHANVIPIFNVGQEGETCFITMRYLEGASLYRVLSRQGIDQTLALRIAEQVVSALDAVHAKGYVHRDVKPENILLTQRGHAFLTDFGVASQLGDAIAAGRGGSPAYMSPEQCRGEALDQRSDYYSLGVTLYQMLAGRRPFLGETSASLMLMHQQDDFPPLRSLVKKVNPALARLIESMLSKDPSKRPTGAEDIIGEIQAIQEELRALRRRSEGLKIRKRSGNLASESGFQRLVKSSDTEASAARAVEVEDVELGLLLLGSDDADTQAIDSAHAGREVQAASQTRFNKSLGVIDEAISKNPEDANLYITRGNVFRKRGMLDDAEESYRKGLELAPKSPRAMTALGACLRLMGHISEAERLLKSAIEREEKNVEARISLGKIYENAGANSLARQQYIQITKSAPHDERGFVALGVLLVQEEKYESAADALEKARALNPSFAPTLFWLGVIQAHRGEKEEAIETLEKAVKAGLRDKKPLLKRPELKVLREYAAYKAILVALKLVPDESSQTR